MNDISVKIEGSPKDPTGAEVSPCTEPGADNEVDPLAIDEADVGTVKDPLGETVRDTDKETAVICDDNAKEKIVCETLCLDSNRLTVLQPEKLKELLKEDHCIRHSVTISPAIEKVEIIEGSPVPFSTSEEVTEPVVEIKILEKPPVVENVKEPLAAVILKDTSPIKEVIPVQESKPEARVPEKQVNVEMTEVTPAEDRIEQKIEKPKGQPMNGDINKDEQGVKRRTSEEIESESPLKKLCQEVEKTFPQHDTMINDYIQTATKNNIDEIQRHTEQLLAEIQTLRELAQKKEHEWNNILHLKKVKEEILLRLLRRKQVLSFEKSPEINGSERTDPFDYLNQAKNLAIDKSDEISGLAIKPPCSTMSPMIQPVLPVTSHFNPMAGLPPPYDKAAHMQSMPKSVYPQPMMMPGPMPGFPRDMNGQLPTGFGMQMGRQGPTKDVKSIIAEYRQRNPEIAPRRGRRMKSILNPNMMNAPRAIAPKVDSMNNLNNLNNLNMLFNNLDMNQKAVLERLQQMQGGGLPNGLSFKDVLVQFANMQQTGAGLLPGRPMEIVTNRPEHHVRPEGRRRQERSHEDVHVSVKQAERLASPSPRLPPPPPYPEISLLPVTTSHDSQVTQQNSLLHGILTKQASPATQSYSPTLAKLLTSPERGQAAAIPPFAHGKNCGEITITPVQPTPPPPDPQPEKPEEVVQLDDEESPASEGEASGSPSGSGSGRLVIDEGAGERERERERAEGGEAGAGEAAEADAPLCQGCRRRDAQFVCAGCGNQWYCSRDCQVAAWDDHSEMCSG